jgi:hypothetical protein
MPSKQLLELHCWPAQLAMLPDKVTASIAIPAWWHSVAVQARRAMGLDVVAPAE